MADHVSHPLHRPIIILGPARSGTTLLAETLLSSHPQIVYWNEPAHVWKAQYSYRWDDLIGPEEADSGYCDFVRDSFVRRMAGAPTAARIMDKTPPNCLRMETVLKVFPDAQFIHVIRDGRAVALSAANEWAGRRTDALDSSDLRRQGLLRRLATLFRREAALRERLRHWRTTIALPAYAIRFVQTLLRQTFHTTRIPWGPRVPGLMAFRRSYSLIETCAFQWEVCTRWARTSGSRLSRDQYLELRFEDLVADPSPHLQRITSYLGIAPFPAGELERLSGLVQDRGETWRSRISKEDLKRVEKRIGVTLVELGYETDGDGATSGG